MKTEKQRYPREVQLDRDVVRDWQPLFAQLTEIADWTLDIAAKVTRDYEDEQTAIERLRRFVHYWLEGRRVAVPFAELLTVVAALLMEIDLATAVQCPGAPHDDDPAVTIRRFPGHRNASGAFHHLTA